MQKRIDEETKKRYFFVVKIKEEDGFISGIWVWKHIMRGDGTLLRFHPFSAV